MAIILKTPSQKKKFKCQIDYESNRIKITSIPAENSFFYNLDALRDLYLWLKDKTENDGWVTLGSINETDTPNAGTVEEWARSPNNPVNGYYGLNNGLKGRFATYIPPILEHLCLAEVEHKAKKNRMRALLIE